MHCSSLQKSIITSSVAVALLIGMEAVIYASNLSQELTDEYTEIISFARNIKQAEHIVHCFKELENPDPTIRYIHNAQLSDIMENHFYPLSYARDLLHAAIAQLTLTCERLQRFKLSFLQYGHEEDITAHNLLIKAQNLLKTILASEDYAQELYMQSYPTTI